jgi:hypothetical protein
LAHGLRVPEAGINIRSSLDRKIHDLALIIGRTVKMVGRLSAFYFGQLGSELTEDCAERFCSVGGQFPRQSSGRFDVDGGISSTTVGCDVLLCGSPEKPPQTASHFSLDHLRFEAPYLGKEIARSARGCFVKSDGMGFIGEIE